MKKRNSSDPQPVKLSVKIGRNFVYLHSVDPDGDEHNASSSALTLGPTGKTFCFVSDLFRFDKSARRKIRKALRAVGRPDLAAQSVPSKPIGYKFYARRREAEIRKHTRGQYEQSDLHGAATV